MSGGWQFDNFGEIEVLLLPCNYIHQEYGDIGDTVSAECIADLDAQKEFLGPLEVLILTNNEKMNLLGYEDDTIKREALIARTQTDQKNPNFIEYKIDASLLHDESDLVKLGFAEEIQFYSAPTEITSTASAWDKFPVNDPLNPDLAFTKYKFTSFAVSINMDLRQINRVTYGLLDWLGDCGGLIDAIFLIAEAIVFPFGSFALK